MTSMADIRSGANDHHGGRDNAAVVRNEDLLALRSYVTAPPSSSQSIAPTTLVLDLTHSNLRQRHVEIRFDKSDTLSTLRDRIHRQTGTPPHHQLLRVLGQDGRTTILELPPDDDAADARMLGYYGLESGQTVHCVDLDPHSSLSANGALENTSLVEKYRMTDEEYDARRGTLREWGREQKAKDQNFSLRKHAREHREQVEANRAAKLGLPLPDGFEYEDGTGKVIRTPKEEQVEKSSEDVEVPGAESVDGIEIGRRCEVRPGGRRGVVRFVGEIPSLGSGGYWIGVLFDEPTVGRKGPADGTVPSGERYFDAPAGRGGFVRGKNLEVGDFPERDIMDELDGSSSEDEL